MAQYMIAVNKGPGKWKSMAWPSNPARYAEAWTDLRETYRLLQGFERVEGNYGGAWQEDEEGMLEQVEAWAMLSPEKHDKLVNGRRP